LQSSEPFFRQGLQRLEAANGHPGTDIRFSTEITQATKHKLRELDLDPNDTTPEELYHALQERVKADDARLNKVLRTRAAAHVSAEGNVVDGMIHALQELPDSKRCFALKPSALKAILKKVPPKKAMKQLGYRSLDSFLKHETAMSALAAAYLSEDASWQKRLLEQYKRLQPGDFEDRSIALVQPDSRGWQQLARTTVAQKKHNLLAFKELGALVFLPLSPDMPSGTTTASLSLALHELNEIRACGTFLKLCQVNPKFGSIVQTVVTDGAQLESKLLDKAVPWHLIQRYYARLTEHDRELAFEPHLQLQDMAWHPVEETLSRIEPSLKFWQQSGHLGLLDRHGPVSLNIVDAALNACNQLPYEQRLAHYFQQALSNELLLRYLQHDTVEQSVSNALQPQLAEEMATT
jgi:hypothetical protein